MRLDRTLLCVVCAVVSVNPCYAERRNYNDDGTRDESLWSEQESRTNSKSGKSKCGISESSGKIRIDSKKGKGGSAAYESQWKMDWTDSFVMEFEHELKSGRPKKTSQSATSGIALGFGDLDPATGYLDGVNLEVKRTKLERTLTASVRVDGEVVDFDTVDLVDSVARDFKLVWTSVGGVVSLDVQLNGNPMPVLSLTGLQTHFEGHEAEGMRVSLFGTSAGNFKFESSFDDVFVSGDDYNDDDADDSGFDDDDGADDADEDGDRDGDGDDSATAATFNSALDAIVASNSLPLLEAESDFESGISVVKGLQWNAADDKLVEVVVNATTGTIVGTPRSWTPTAGQRDKYEDSISVIGLVEMSATDAVSQAIASNLGSTVHAIELEEENRRPMWQVELVTASGLELEVRIWAD
jgi:uncharacterized membrane protein YkoI